jgi:hypothetical protein
MENSLNKIFKKNKNIIIGAIHFPPLFGYKDFPGTEIALRNTLHDLKAFEDGGTDGIIIENNYDVPHKIAVDKETVEMMTYLGKEIKKATRIPIGVSVLWNDYKAALFIAKEIGAQFIRVPVFVDNVKTDYGEVFGEPKDVLDYRREMGIENIALFTDIHVKHAELLDEKTIESSAIEAIKSGSDALIITGKWTAQAPKLDDLIAVKNTVNDFPILIGSGIDESNAKELFEYINGAIVSTSLKEGNNIDNGPNIKSWKQRIDKNKVTKLVESLY